jgi:hypothetical protein
VQLRLWNEANERFIEEHRKNTVIFDARILFHRPELTDAPAPTDEQIAEHKAELRSILGDEGFDKYYEYAEKKIDQYEEDLQSERDYWESELSDNPAEVERQIDVFVSKNSPYIYAEVMEKGYNSVKHNGLHVYPTNRYVRPIPKKEVDGESTGFYDDKFITIQQNESYLALYNEIFDMLQELKSYLPNEKINFMQLNSLPTLRKKVLENMTGDDGSIAAAFSRSREMIIESIRDDNLTTVGTPEEEKEHQFHILQNNRERIRNYIQLQDTKYRAENEGKPSTPEMEQEWRKDIMDEIAREKSFDLGRVMKAFASLAVTYKHRAAIEDQMRLSQDIINRAVETRQNSAGKPITDKNGNIIGDKGLKNVKTMLQDFMDVAYWGYETDITKGGTGRKVLTPKEKTVTNCS